MARRKKHAKRVWQEHKQSVAKAPVKPVVKVREASASPPRPKLVQTKPVTKTLKPVAQVKAKETKGHEVKKVKKESKGLSGSSRLDKGASTN